MAQVILNSKYEDSGTDKRRKSGITPVLRQMGVVVMLAGNMGQGAKKVLEAQESCDHHDCH